MGLTVNAVVEDGVERFAVTLPRLSVDVTASTVGVSTRPPTSALRRLAALRSATQRAGVVSIGWAAMKIVVNVIEADFDHFWPRMQNSDFNF